MRKVFVIVDMQNGFLKGDNKSFISRVCEKTLKRKAEGYEILLTSDRCGGAIVKEVAEITARCKIYKKRSYGCKNLIEELAALKPVTVEFAGVCTDVCVICNVLAAKTFLPETQIVLDADCCHAETKAGQIAALAVMRACGVAVSDGE